jgi:uncharacterized repeat protein (TIGR01451 family)
MVMLKAPNGYGTDLIYLRGFFLSGPSAGDGDNFVNTRIDDQATADLNQAQPAAAPFTGSWKPAFNSPIWSLFGIPNLGPDPVGQLSRINGQSTKGTWRVHVTDVINLNSGTLNSWSLIVTPRAFSCAPFAPAPLVGGTKTVAGSLIEGEPITYTVTLTNSAAVAQPDNPGAEFTDVLSPEVALVSASASNGVTTATTSTNTVTWNGSIAGGGSTTITIVATIKPDTAGTTIDNQGRIAYDADNNGSNEARALTDDPGTAAPDDPTSFVVATDHTTIYLPVIARAP